MPATKGAVPTCHCGIVLTALHWEFPGRKRPDNYRRTLRWVRSAFYQRLFDAGVLGESKSIPRTPVAELKALLIEEPNMLDN